MKPAVKKEIDRAKLLYEQYGRELSRDKHIKELLERYREANIKTLDKIREIGVEEGCTFCAVELDECCCFEGVEEKYDYILLLVNLLLGAEISEYREIPAACLFVGSQGCLMAVRHYFCLHYLCPQLKTSLDPSAIDDFLSVSGDELYCGLETEQAIRGWLKQNAELKI
ncbi:MAG: hypothetical protein JRG97_12045, partial [Deltaproteobacteria bacterium]|nr:hypothetical protein [Deltaproteobacteria bacterium]MBW2141780.1 hypothetical protein [Deltaproteobacteria bacterium]